MGKGGGGNIKSKPVVAEEPVTPAVARTVERDAETMQGNAEERRARMRGIRSTYSRFAEAANSGQNGVAKRLG